MLFSRLFQVNPSVGGILNVLIGQQEQILNSNKLKLAMMAVPGCLIDFAPDMITHR